MIHVNRGAVPVPKALTGERVEHQRAQIASLLAEEGRREQVRIDFRSEIYISVQRDLLELFHHKCAYCESPVGEAGAADIEHFRPKQGASDIEGKKREHLYYAWLAYDWDNLLLIACAACNRRRRSTDGRVVGKGDRFPVVGERAPLLSSVEQCRAVEDPLLLDPCYDEPSEHLRFEDNGTCMPLSTRGELTIALLDLNRSFLVGERERTARHVILLAQEWVRRAGGDPGRASGTSSEVQDLLSGARPYTAAARQAFARFQASLQPPYARQVDIVDTLRNALPEKDLTRAVQASEARPSDLTPEIQKAATSSPEQYEGRAALPPYAQARLTRIVIRNFKAIENLELEVPVVSTEANDAAGALMLLGENATGKSTVLEAIALALLGRKHASKLNVDRMALRRRAVDGADAPGNDEPPRVELWFEGFEKPRTLAVRNGRLQGDADPATILLGYGPRRFFRSDGKGRLAGPAPFERVRTLFDPIATITNPSDWLAKLAPDQFNAIVRALKKLLMLPDGGDYVHKPTGKGDDTEITFTMDGIDVPLSALSEGYRTIIATSVDVMRELLRYWPDLESAQGVVLIDEVETHLHPRWKMRIVRLLRQAMPRVQFIMTTHDPLCLRGLEDGEVTVMFRDEQRRVSTVTDLPSIAGLSVQQLLTSEYFGLYTTEDPRAEEQLSNYVALANKTDRTEDEEREFERQRDIALKRLAPGTLPAQRVVYEAVNATLQQNAEQTRYNRADLNREAMAKAIELFTSTDN